MSNGPMLVPRNSIGSDLNISSLKGLKEASIPATIGPAPPAPTAATEPSRERINRASAFAGPAEVCTPAYTNGIITTGTLFSVPEKLWPGSGIMSYRPDGSIYFAGLFRQYL